MEDKNYWMFRSKGSAKLNPNFCIENNVITYGWCDFDFKLGDPEPTRSEAIEKSLKTIKEWTNSNRAVSMARKFTWIKKGDIVVLPAPWSIHIGEVGDYEYRSEWYADGTAPTFKVNWLVKHYPRNSLPSRFQSSLKYRGTFKNLGEYREAINGIISSGGKDQEHAEEKSKKHEKLISELSKRLNERHKTSFSDREFEEFIMHLFELEYSLETRKNSQRQEAQDGKDFTMFYKNEKLNEFFDDGSIKINVQVKQHSWNASPAGIDQISKSDDSDEYAKNVLVTTGNLTADIEKKAEAADVKLFGPDDIAEMIIRNKEKIAEKFLSKLGIDNQIVFIE